MPADSSKGPPGLCTCMSDGFADLPPELRPRTDKKGSLREVTCPRCGLVYWTNRATDLCMECEHAADVFSTEEQT